MMTKRQRQHLAAKKLIEKQAYEELIRFGWSSTEARARAEIIARAKAGPCRCHDVRHLPCDDHCPDSPTYKGGKP